MATTIASINITSTDLLSDSLSLSAIATLTTAGSSTGLTHTEGLGRKTLASGHAQYVLFDGGGRTADKAHKIHDADNDIKIDPSAVDMALEYMLFTDD